jgi:hypothetical protein
MRYLVFSVLCGLLLGACMSWGTAKGACNNTNISHSSGGTCCACCGIEDYTVDQIWATTGSEFACILATEVDNVSTFTYAGWQCQTVGQTHVNFTVEAGRSVRTDISQWETESTVGGTQCNNGHTHNSNYFEDNCGINC